MSSTNLQYAVCCLKKKLNNNTLPTEVRDALLAAINPSGTNRFITADEITDFVTETELNTAIDNLTEIVVVENYSALPDPTLHTGEFYWVENTQGTKWLPFSLGGTFYNSGLYYSNGVAWTFLEVPYQATQLEVNTGTNNDKFVTPLTLNNYNKWDEKLDVSALPSNLVLYATTTPSVISGYNLMVTNIADVDYDVVAVDVSTGVITTTNQLVGQLVTREGIIEGNVGILNISTVGNIRRVSGSGTAEFYYKVFHRTNLGVETLVATSSSTNHVTNNTYEQFLATALLNNGVFLPTDTIVIKYYANRITGGSNPTYEFQFGGSIPVRTVIPVPLEAIGYTKKEVDTLLATATFTVDLSVDLTVDFYAPYDLRVNSVTNIVNTPTTTITVNSAAYTLGDLITQGDMITVDVDVNGVINLNVVYE